MDGNQTPEGQPELPQPFQPGETISPGSVPTPASPSLVLGAAASEAVEPLPPAADTPIPPPVETPVPLPVEASVPQPVFEAAPETDFPASYPTNPVSWTASEFIAHEKSVGWYILLFGGAIIAAGVTWLVSKDILSAVVIVLAAGVLAAYSSRKPRELQYMLDEHGITIGEKHYPYASFRSFSVIEDGAFSSIELMPIKRFSPPLSVYYDLTIEDAIAEILTPHVPFQARELDPVDKLLRRIRF